MSGYISAAGAAAIEKAQAAGYIIGPEWSSGMMALRRHGESEPNIWLDVGDTVRFVGDESDAGYALFFEIVELFDGRDAVRRTRVAWNTAIGRESVTVADLRALIADLPDGMPVAVRGYETGYDPLEADDVRVLPLTVDVLDSMFGISGPDWYDGRFMVGDGGTPHLTLGFAPTRRAE